MAEFHEQTARPSGGSVGTPFMVVRNDPGGDLSSGDQKYAFAQSGSDGALKVNSEGMKATFSLASLDVAVAATPTDIITLSGSATATVKVTRVEIALNDATGSTAVADLQLVKRTTANTGGTSSAITLAKHDSGDTIPTDVTALAYTANPSTLGTSAGVIRAQKLALTTAGATAGSGEVDSVIWDFGTRPGAKEITLRGVNQLLCINGNGSAYGTTPSMTVSIEGTVEPSTV